MGTDIRPVTLISQASLDLVDGDGRRFRMLFEIEGFHALEEESWRNRRLHIGEATLLIGRPTPRCAFPSADPDTGRRDRDVLRELIEARGGVQGQACLGVYAEVLRPGLVRVGDAVRLGSAITRPTRQWVDRMRILQAGELLGWIRRPNARGFSASSRTTYLADAGTSAPGSHLHGRCGRRRRTGHDWVNRVATLALANRMPGYASSPLHRRRRHDH